MIPDSLKNEVLSLGSKERRELMGFMVALQIKEDPDYREALTDRIIDTDPSRQGCQPLAPGRAQRPPGETPAEKSDPGRDRSQPPS